MSNTNEEDDREPLLGADAAPQDQTAQREVGLVCDLRLCGSFAQVSGSVCVFVGAYVSVSVCVCVCVCVCLF